MTSDEGRAEVLAETYGIAKPTVVRNVPERVESVVRDEVFRSEAIGSARYLLIYQGVLVPNRALVELVTAMAFWITSFCTNLEVEGGVSPRCIARSEREVRGFR